MSIYPPNTTPPKKGLNYLWNYLGSSLKTFAAALSPYMGGGDVGYKKYVALFTYDGVSTTVTVLENTIGTIIVTDVFPLGRYEITTPGGFEVLKTFLLGSGNSSFNGGFAYFITGSVISGVLELDVNDANGAPVDPGQGYPFYVEIRVYP